MHNMQIYTYDVLLSSYSFQAEIEGCMIKRYSKKGLMVLYIVLPLHVKVTNF